MTRRLRAGSPAEAGMCPERVAKARDLCASWVADGHTPALSVCVARRGIVVLHESLGRLGPEPDAPAIDHRSLFPLSSCTKPITATVVMQLVEDGRIGLNRALLDYVPEIRAKGAEEILVHHLLTHTSGYTHYTEEPLVSHAARQVAEGFRVRDAGPGRHPLHTGLIQLFLDAPLAGRPGELMTYSNHNYELLSEIVRRVTGRPHWELARERVFAPLRMRDSSYIVPEADAARVVRRPLDAPGGAPENPFSQGTSSRQMQETPYAGGGVFSTARDLATFGQMFLNGGRYGDARILSPASVRAMTCDQIPGTPALFLGHEMKHASWGYGWGVVSPSKWKQYRGGLRSLGSYDHGGAGGTFLWVDPDLELVGVYLEVCLRQNENLEQLANADLFQDAIGSAVEG